MPIVNYFEPPILIRVSVNFGGILTTDYRFWTEGVEEGYTYIGMFLSEAEPSYAYPFVDQGRYEYSYSKVTAAATELCIADTVWIQAVGLVAWIRYDNGLPYYAYNTTAHSTYDTSWTVSNTCVFDAISGIHAESLSLIAVPQPEPTNAVDPGFYLYYYNKNGTSENPVGGFQRHYYDIRTMTWARIDSSITSTKVKTLSFKGGTFYFDTGIPGRSAKHNHIWCYSKSGGVFSDITNLSAPITNIEEQDYLVAVCGNKALMAAWFEMDAKYQWCGYWLVGTYRNSALPYRWTP
jgi:hypothetical protein